jgi:hypothetical protein
MKRGFDDSVQRSVIADAPFQSLQPYMGRGADKRAAIDALAKKINDTVSDTYFFVDSKNEGWRDKVWAMINHMIDCEQKAWELDYFVFYRVVSEKYALYEFNTIMLALFSKTRPTVEALRLMCVPSLFDECFPDSIEAAFQFYSGFDNDSSPNAARSLISVNNCLNPTRRQNYDFVYHMIHDAEASPLKFLFEGYNETIEYSETMREFTEKFFGLNKDDARALVTRIMELYDNFIKVPNADGNAARGHTLQICIPRAAINKFVYQCASWGHPARIFKDCAAGDASDDELHQARVHAFPVFESQQYYSNASSEGMTLTSQEEHLRSPNLSNLQSRIIAHPNLFLEYGAVTNVFHGNQSFDEVGFRRSLIALLRPHIDAAIVRQQSLSYSRFETRGALGIFSSAAAAR